MAKWNMRDRLPKMVGAYNKRELGCFTNPLETCEYTYEDGSHCVIGSALTEEELKVLAGDNLGIKYVEELFHRGILQTSFDTVITNLELLQEAHDDGDIIQLGKELKRLCNYHKVKIEVDIAA